MKPKLLIIAILFCSNLIYGQSKKELRHQKRTHIFFQTDSLIQSKQYRFEASRAIPTGMQPVNLATHIADIDIVNDSAISHLPFYGRAYEASYTGEGGIKFECPLIDYKIVKDTTKNYFNISFNVKTNQDNYQFYLSVSYSGSASLSVTSNKRAHISYHGKVVPIK